MGIITTDNKHYSDIADAIRRNKAEEETYTPAQMADEIDNACTVQYEIGFSEGMQAGHRIEQGVFTLETDSSSIALNIPSGAKMIEIVPQGTPAVSTNTPIPVSYLFAAECFQNNNVAYPGKGAVVEYDCYGFHTTFFEYNATGGFTIDLGEYLFFEAGMPYLWTAHYWQE